MLYFNVRNLHLSIRRLLTMARSEIVVGGLYDRRDPYFDQLGSELQKKCSGIVISAIVPCSWHLSEQKNVTINPEDVAKLQQSEILITDPYLFENSGIHFPNLKWIHSYWAGVDRFTRKLDKCEIPSYILTRNGRSFSRYMAQYVLGYMVAHERHFETMRRNQAAKIWDPKLPYGDMSELTLGILGLGAIGREIASLAKAVNMTVMGLVRTLPSESERSKYVDEYRTTADLPELLSACNYVCSVLPSTSSTDGLLDGDLLSHCKNKRSVFINIGRGNVVKNATVLNALEQGWLSHAILDVFEEEPLPQDSPLWTHPNLTVTPHVSGTGLSIKKFAEDFAVNLEHYKKGEPMDFVVDWTKGY